MEASIPIPTMIVNIGGSFLLGLIVGMDVTASVYFILAIGFLGAFTTFSTFAVEAVTLYREKRRMGLYIYILGTFLGGFYSVLQGGTLVSIYKRNIYYLKKGQISRVA